MVTVQLLADIKEKKTSQTLIAQKYQDFEAHCHI